MDVWIVRTMAAR